jgi:phosphoglucosamine mutase
VARAAAELGEDGKILVRPIGTEPTIRLMIQAKDAVVAERVISRLADEVRLALR